MTNTALTSTTDTVDFMRLPAEVRSDVTWWEERLSKVQKPIQANLELIAQQRGVSHQTARRKYDSWNANGWRGLVNRAKAPEKRGLNRDVIQHWQSLCEQNARKCKPAYDTLMCQWHSGEPIPGIPAGTDRSVLPRGLGYDNLMRHAPTKWDLNAARIGSKAADDFRPKVFTTREGLHVNEFIMFDDVWHDLDVVKIGHKEEMRLLQLHALDVLSGDQFARGIKPRLTDPETQKRVNLTENEMLYLVAHVLSDIGFYRCGCTLMVENGTAALSAALEDLLAKISGGLIKVKRANIDRASAFAGQYCGAAKGNFRFKAAIESFLPILSKRKKKMLILGDMLELGDYADQEHRGIVELLKQKKDIEVCLVGSLFEKNAQHTPFSCYKTVEELKSYL